MLVPKLKPCEPIVQSLNIGNCELLITPVMISLMVLYMDIHDKFVANTCETGPTFQ